MVSRNDTDEEAADENSLLLPDIIRNESRFIASLFGYRQAMNLHFATGFDEVLKNYDMLEIYCDAQTDYSTDYENVTVDLSIEEALQYPRRIADRTPMDIENPRQFTMRDLKLMWCRLVSHYFEWLAGVPELRMMSDLDKIRLVTRQLCKVICFTIAYRTYNLGIDSGISFGAGLIYRPQDDKDPTIRNYASALADVIQTLVVSKIRSLRMSREEYILVKLAILFSQTSDIALSPMGREIVASALNKYTTALVDRVTTANPLLPKRQVLLRIAEMLSVLPHMETVSEVDDRHLMELTLNNNDNLQGRLSTEIHVHSTV